MIQAPFLLSLLGMFLFGIQDEGARVARDPGPRAEHFVLEVPAPALAPGSFREVGTVCLRRRGIEGGFQLEGEWCFLRSEAEGGDERVLHVEQIRSGSARLIWREWGPSRARSLTVDRSADGFLLATIDTGRGGTERETIETREGAVLPLEFLERMRSDEPVPATCGRFDPLTRSVDRVDLKLVLPIDGADLVRTVEIARADGSIVARYEFRGSELRSIRLQDGDLVARRVTEEEYRTRSPHPAVTIQRP